MCCAEITYLTTPHHIPRHIQHQQLMITHHAIQHILHCRVVEIVPANVKLAQHAHAVAWIHNTSHVTRHTSHITSYTTHPHTITCAENLSHAHAQLQ